MQVKVFIATLALATAANALASASSYCTMLDAKAQLKSKAWPFVFTSYSQEEQRSIGPAKKAQAYVGFVFNIDDLLDHMAEVDFASAECRRYHAELDYLGSLNAILANAEKEGRQAQLNFLEEGLRQKSNELELLEQRLATQNATIFEILDTKQIIHQRQQDKIIIEQQFLEVAKTPLAPPLAAIQQLREKNVEAAKQSASAQAPILGVQPWNVGLEAGYEMLPEREDPTPHHGRQPYFQTQVTYYLGALSNNAERWRQAQEAWLANDPSGASSKGQGLIAKIQNEFDMTTKKLNTLVAYRGDLEHLAIPLHSQGDTSARTAYSKISNELSKLALEEAYLKAKKKSLLPYATSQEDTSQKQKQTKQSVTFVVTKGDVAAAGAEKYRVTSDQLRLRVEDTTGDAISVRFHYQGLGKNPAVAMGSGLTRHQFGVFLLAENQCNMLYVMLRLDSKNQATIAVQGKRNPEQALHLVCQNHGYETIKPAFTTPIGELKPDSSIDLTAKVNASGMLVVEVDKKMVWQGSVAELRLPKNGYSGIRTDNVAVEFTVERF